MSNAMFCSRRQVFTFLAMLSASAMAGGSAYGFAALERKASRVRSPEKSFLQAAAMAGEKRMVAVGERGIVLLSDDKGSTWRQSTSVPVSVTLTAVFFVNDRLGWAVGHGAVILNTRDGGETWSLQADGRSLAKLAKSSAEQRAQVNPDDAAAKRELKAAELLVSDGPDKPLLDVVFKDANNGWVVGAFNLFFETSDGGRSWRSAMGRLENPKAMHLYAIRVQGPRVFVAGEQGLLLRSDDNAASFKSLPSPYQGTWFSMTVAPTGLVMAGLRGNAFFSRDQGESWSAISGAPPVTFVASTLLRDGHVLLANQAGQLWATRNGQPMKLKAAVAMPMAAGLTEVGPEAWLITGSNGVVMASMNPQNKTTP